VILEEPGTYKFKVTVSSGETSDEDVTTIRVREQDTNEQSSENSDESQSNNIEEEDEQKSTKQLTAHLQAPNEATVGEQITLDGSNSENPESGELTYEWKLVSAPSEADAGRLQWLLRDDEPTANLTLETPGTYEFKLAVSTLGRATDEVTKTVTVREEEDNTGESNEQSEQSSPSTTSRIYDQCGTTGEQQDCDTEDRSEPTTPTSETSESDEITTTPTSSTQDSESMGQTVTPPFTEEFKSGLNGWTIDLHPDAADRVTKGTGTWHEKYGGSIHLHVDGGPNHVGVYRKVGSLQKGTKVRVNYESPNLDGQPGGPRILLHLPDSDEIIGLDMDAGRKKHDGVLEGTVPQDLPAGTELEVRLGVWPGEIDVFVTNITVERPGTQKRNAEPKERDTPSPVERVGPKPEVTVAPNSQMFFEVAARNYSGEYLDTMWYVNGKKKSAIGPYHAEFQSKGKDFLRHTFESTGTHEVRVEVYDKNGQKLGEKEWTVRITGESENTAPSVKPVAPDGDLMIPKGETKQVEFQLQASDPDGDLHRAIWWLSQCDQYLGSTSLDGGQDTASITHEASPHGCGIYAWVVDKNGVMTRIEDGWMLQRQTTTEPTETSTTEMIGPTSEEATTAESTTTETTTTTTTETTTTTITTETTTTTTTATTTTATTSTIETTTTIAEDEILSFEDGSVDDPELADAEPWYLVSKSGTHELTNERASHGEQSLHLAGEQAVGFAGVQQTDASVVAVNVDLSDVMAVKYDIYTSATDTTDGELAISLDSLPTNGGEVLADIDGELATEQEWVTGKEVDVSDIDGDHMLYIVVDGETDAYIDGVQFYDATGDLVQTSDVVLDPTARQPTTTTTTATTTETTTTETTTTTTTTTETTTTETTTTETTTTTTKTPDTDNDGVPDSNDNCPQTKGDAESNGCPDSDGDGVTDSNDECPETKGSSDNNGCPDSDGDGIVNSNDECPDAKGSAENNGCPDNDDDGVTDSKDECPDTVGSAENNGCPDSDGDGVIDSNDECPETTGRSQNDGCPDSDEDGVTDSNDECPETRGSSDNNGCPDSDGDGVINSNDECPETEGSAKNNGCPDSDGDGVIDSNDECLETTGSAESNGCPDSDGDGVTDYNDECRETEGSAENNGCPDSDGDGVVDSSDECPETKGDPETKGCPDGDGDGVLDSNDECPETKGSAENNGCLDSDADGVIDSNDECPETEGNSEYDGCPDSDSDGVIDSNDECPETEGSQDNTGCPKNEETTSSSSSLSAPILPETTQIGMKIETTLG
jgi:hypothetical protein